MLKMIYDEKLREQVIVSDGVRRPQIAELSDCMRVLGGTGIKRTPKSRPMLRIPQSPEHIAHVSKLIESINEEEETNAKEARLRAGAGGEG